MFSDESSINKSDTSIESLIVECKEYQQLIRQMETDKHMDFRLYDTKDLAKRFIRLSKNSTVPLHSDNPYNKETLIAVFQKLLTSLEVRKLHPAPGQQMFQPDTFLPKQVARDIVRVMQEEARMQTSKEKAETPSTLETKLRHVRQADEIRQESSRTRCDLSQMHLGPCDYPSELKNANDTEVEMIKVYTVALNDAAEEASKLIGGDIDLVHTFESVFGDKGFGPYEYQDPTTDICFVLVDKVLR